MLVPCVSDRFEPLGGFLKRRIEILLLPELCFKKILKIYVFSYVLKISEASGLQRH